MKSYNRQILQILQKMGQEMNSVTATVNWGGCAIVAAMVGREMQKLWFEVDIVTPVYGEGNYKNGSEVAKKIENRNSAWEWSEKGLSRAHLALRFRLGRKLYTWDTDVLTRNGSEFGRGEYPCRYPFGNGLTVKDTEAMCVPQEGWNRYFDRAHVPALKAICLDHMEHIQRVIKRAQQV